MSEGRRLHRAAVVLLALRALRAGAAPLLGIGAVALLGGGLDAESLLRVAAFGALGAVLAGVSGVVDWRTTRYVVDDTALRLRSGLLNRRQTSVPLGRIQSVDVGQGPLERLLGVVALEVQTAGGAGQAEVRLAALAPAEARRVQALLGRAADLADDDGERELCRSLSTRGLLVTALTAPQFGVVLPALTVLTQVFDDVLPRVVDLGATPTPFGIARAVAALLVAAWVVSFLAAMISFAGFELRRDGDRLRISRGIFARRVVTMPVSRVQAVVVVEGLARQPFGLAAVRIAVAGYADQPAAAQMLFPLLPARDVGALLRGTVPELAAPSGSFERPPVRARRRYIALPGAVALLGAIAAALAISPWLLVLAAGGPLLGLARWRDAGLMLDGDRVTIRERRLARHTTHALRRGVQWRSTIRTPLQARADLVRLVIVTARGTRASIAQLDAARARAVLAALGT